MASQETHPEIIDLTASEVPESQLEIIVLSDSGSDIHEVAGPSAQTAKDASHPASNTNGAAQPQQTKKKRKRRKRKAAGNDTPAQTTEYEEGELSSGEASPADTPTVSGTNVQGDGSGGPNSGSVLASASGKKSLADRISEPSRGERKEAPTEPRRRREKRESARTFDDEHPRAREREAEKVRTKESRRERDRHHEKDRYREKDGRRAGDRRRSRSPQHDHERDRARRRSQSRERGGHEHDRDRRRHDKAADNTNAPLFFEDITPAEIPGLIRPSGHRPGTSTTIATAARVDVTVLPESHVPDLLLPAHVSVVQEGDDSGMSPLDVPTPEGSDEEDYIDYLDYDDDRRAPGMVRYWELEKLNAQKSRTAKPTRFICKKCGAEGEHKTYECTVLICLTCGVRDEHPTRSCPISKVCFTCGMKGHINKTCPNRGKAGPHHSSHDCDRCGARTHQTNECPTLWRIYNYVEDNARQDILQAREGKRVLALGQGGEGYIATDEWCYNCGECGHLGDDCTEAEHLFDKPPEHSAFSLYNILSGPFSSETSRPSKRGPRDWESASAFADGYGSTLPMQVGKQGRDKERDRLARKARELEDAQDDQDDWFGRTHTHAKSKSRKDSKSSNHNAVGKIKFNLTGSSLGDDRDRKRQRYDDLPGPSTEMDNLQIRGASARKQSYSSTSSRDRHDRYEREPERDHGDRSRNRDTGRGPRYKGGYSR